MIRTGLGGRVGRAGGIRSGFGKQTLGTFQIAIHLIGRNVMEAECRFTLLRKTTPVTAHALEQGVGTDDIGLDEVCRPVDGAIHMRFGGQVHHRRWLELGQHRI
ncbi:hypothetical protein D3C78_1368780 [compost metagenome]